MDAPPAFPGLDLSTSYGCMLAGAFLSCAMWGVSSLQTFLYFALYESDPTRLKILVAFLWLMDTANQILLLKAIWPTLITHWGDVRSLARIIPELSPYHAWVGQIVEFCVQMYFIHRIFVFSGRKWVFPACMVVLSVTQIVLLIPYQVYTISGGSGAELLSSHPATSMVISLRAVTAAEDVLLSLTLIYLIVRRGLPEFHKTRRLVVRLLVVTANTGLWTAILAFIELALAARFPTGLQFTVPEFPLCSVYFSSFLASLNARDYIRGTDHINTDMPSKLVAANPSSNISDGSTLYLGPLGKSAATASKMGHDERLSESHEMTKHGHIV